jgi:hypothetical protein
MMLMYDGVKEVLAIGIIQRSITKHLGGSIGLKFLSVALVGKVSFVLCHFRL